MTQPNFEAMSRKELRAYVLQHREDVQAFRALVTKLTAEPPKATFPAPTSVDDLSHFPELLERFRQERS